MDIQNTADFLAYLKIDLWIAINRIMDMQKILFLNFHYSIFGYPQFDI